MDKRKRVLGRTEVPLIFVQREGSELQDILDRAKQLIRDRPEYRFEEEKNLGLHEYERGHIDHEHREQFHLLDQ